MMLHSRNVNVAYCNIHFFFGIELLIYRIVVKSFVKPTKNSRFDFQARLEINNKLRDVNLRLEEQVSLHVS